jgi:hypothetical protein
MQISSRSIKMMLPMPLLTSASAAHDPTPPSPIIATVAEESRERIVSLVGVEFCLDDFGVGLFA